jgi:hypothetical protein
VPKREIRHIPAGTALAFWPPMQRFTPRLPVDRAAWQYSFCAYLAYREAPASPAQLRALAQALQVMKGHLNPIAAADAVLLTWPFEVTE